MNEQQLYKINQVLQIVGGALTIVLIVRMVKPDATRTAQMRVHRAISRQAKRQADMWTAIAAHSDTSYMRLRNVTV